MYKVSRRFDLDIATFGAAIRIGERDGVVGRAAVAYTGVAPTVVRLPETEAFLRGRPFEEATFDVVWTQGMFMNIADKPRLFAEAYRVLRPGGRLAFQASLAGPVPGVYYPTF